MRTRSTLHALAMCGVWFAQDRLEHFTAADTRHRLGELLKDKSETVN